MQIKYRYFPFPVIDPITKRVIETIYRPIVPIRLSYNHRLSKYPFNCLVDSGSDRNLFPAVLGEQEGIKVKKGKEIGIVGIGNSVIKGYKHLVKIYLGTLGINTEVDFSYAQQVPLLGRDGFFNKFDLVKFDDKNHELTLDS